jgi:hypothetical protein
MDDIGMIKGGGGLAWLLGGKGRIVGNVANHQSCVDLGGYTGTGLYRERGRKQYKYKADKAT